MKNSERPWDDMEIDNPLQGCNSAHSHANTDCGDAGKRNMLDVKFHVLMTVKVTAHVRRTTVSVLFVEETGGRLPIKIYRLPLLIKHILLPAIGRTGLDVKLNDLPDARRRTNRTHLHNILIDKCIADNKE